MPVVHFPCTYLALKGRFVIDDMIRIYVSTFHYELIKALACRITMIDSSLIKNFRLFPFSDKNQTSMCQQ